MAQSDMPKPVMVNKRGEGPLKVSKLRWRRRSIPDCNRVPYLGWFMSCRATYNEAGPLIYSKAILNFESIRPGFIRKGLEALPAQWRHVIMEASVGKLWLTKPPQKDRQFRVQQRYEEWPTDEVGQDDLFCEEWAPTGKAVVEVMQLLYKFLPDLFEAEIHLAICGYWEAPRAPNFGRSLSPPISHWEYVGEADTDLIASNAVNILSKLFDWERQWPKGKDSHTIQNHKHPSEHRFLENR